MSVENIASAIELIKTWMTQRGISEGLETKPTPGGFSFHFTGKSASEMPFTIIQPEQLEKTVIIISEVRIAEEHIKSIKAMRSKDCDEFFYNLRKNIVFAPAQYAFDPDFEKTGILKSIQFSKEICYDGLTEDRLNEAVQDVVRGAIFVIWQIRKEFGDTTEE
ncbi:MAG: DUF2299 domain-containing protein [Methanothrix sp.]|nr:MAG: DUF2299 domain-containing protein [Methanothrix sp.]